MLKNNSKLLYTFASIVLLGMLSACSDTASSSEETVQLGGENIEIPYMGDGSTARSLVLAEVLEDAGYDVTRTRVEASGPLYASTAENTDTLHASGRFPSTDKAYLDKYGNNLEVYNDENLIDDAAASLVVPEYMDDISSIEDMKDNKELGESVDWTITGTDPRNGVMINTEDGLEDNDLDDWDLSENSELYMLTELQNKYEKQEPIIITGWQPHWIFEEMDLKMLDDPGNIYGGEDEYINLVFNKEFKKEHPAAYLIATRMAKDWNEEYEQAMMKQIIVEGENQERVAEEFVEDNSNKVDKWQRNIE